MGWSHSLPVAIAAVRDARVPVSDPVVDTADEDTTADRRSKGRALLPAEMKAEMILRSRSLCCPIAYYGCC